MDTAPIPKTPPTAPTATTRTSAGPAGWLQKALGEEYLVIEEGLSGRTTVFVDALHESMDALSVAYPTLMAHEPVDLLIIMLGTNDVKERFGVGAPMGNGCVEKSEALAQYLAPVAERNGCHFFDARGCEFNNVDHMHLSRRGHAQLAEKLAALVPTLV